LSLYMVRSNVGWAYDGNGKIDGCDGMDDVWIIEYLDVPGS